MPGMSLTKRSQRALSPLMLVVPSQTRGYRDHERVALLDLVQIDARDRGGSVRSGLLTMSESEEDADGIM
jgi:hypothetical protein